MGNGVWGVGYVPTTRVSPVACAPLLLGRVGLRLLTASLSLLPTFHASP